MCVIKAYLLYKQNNKHLSLSFLWFCRITDCSIQFSYSNHAFPNNRRTHRAVNNLSIPQYYSIQKPVLNQTSAEWKTGYMSVPLRPHKHTPTAPKGDSDWCNIRRISQSFVGTSQPRTFQRLRARFSSSLKCLSHGFFCSIEGSEWFTVSVAAFCVLCVHHYGT